jgi:hypothetical protein
MSQCERGRVTRIGPKFGFIRAEDGSDFIFGAKSMLGGEARYVELRMGDAVFFDPDLDRHGGSRAQYVQRVPAT